MGLRRYLYKAMPEEENGEQTSCVMETTNNAWNKPVIVDGKAQQVTKKFFGSSDSGSSKHGTKDSGCDSASSNSFLSMNKARKSVAMKINISQSGVTVSRQPKDRLWEVGLICRGWLLLCKQM